MPPSFPTSCVGFCGIWFSHIAQVQAVWTCFVFRVFHQHISWYMKCSIWKPHCTFVKRACRYYIPTERVKEKNNPQEFKKNPHHFFVSSDAIQLLISTKQYFHANSVLVNWLWSLPALPSGAHKYSSWFLLWSQFSTVSGRDSWPLRPGLLPGHGSVARSFVSAVWPPYCPALTSAGSGWAQNGTTAGSEEGFSMWKSRVQEQNFLWMAYT